MGLKCQGLASDYLEAKLGLDLDNSDFGLFVYFNLTPPLDNVNETLVNVCLQSVITDKTNHSLNCYTSSFRRTEGREWIELV